MKSKKRNIETIIRLLIVIILASFLNIGCTDNLRNTGSPCLESNIFDLSVSETIINNHPQEEEISVGDVHLLEREDKISTMFYDLQLDKVTITDSIGGMMAESGREFMVLDVTITAWGDEKVISMYAQEFLMVCFLGNSVKADSEEDYEKLYPLEEGLAEGQLSDVWLAAEGEDIEGKLIYNIPKDAIRMVLLVYDSYTTGDLKNEVVFGDGYMITIPEENWNRVE